MVRAATPRAAIKVEHVRNGDGFDVDPEFAVALQEQVVVADRIVLHVTVGVRR
jgi:hypothetical protein